jgi:prevent-host-death family protein
MQQKAVAEIKRDLEQVLELVERGEEVVVVRDGQPIAVIAPLTPEHPSVPGAKKSGGLLSVLGTFEDWPEIEEDMAAIVAARQQAEDRPPPTFD